MPPIKGIESIDYLTSDNLWELRENPGRLVVLGGGPIGCELTQAFSRLGSDVTLVEMAPQLLGREDADAANAVLESLRDHDGVNVALSTKAIRCEGNGSSGTLVCEQNGEEVEVGVTRYAMNPDGSIATTFTFHEGDYNGKLKTYRPTGYVSEQDNSLWGMQFIWPIKAEYRIIYLTEDYTQTVIGRTKRDYVWIMARQPSIPDDDYQRILGFLREQGYLLDNLKKVSHTANEAAP